MGVIETHSEATEIQLGDVNSYMLLLNSQRRAEANLAQELTLQSSRLTGVFYRLTVELQRLILDSRCSPFSLRSSPELIGLTLEAHPGIIELTLES
jgi:hypothetical protein